MHQASGQLARIRRAEGVDHSSGRCQFSLGDPSALGNQGRIHSRFESVEVLAELLACFAGLELGPALLGGSVDS